MVSGRTKASGVPTAIVVGLLLFSGAYSFPGTLYSEPQFRDDEPLLYGGDESILFQNEQSLLDDDFGAYREPVEVTNNLEGGDIPLGVGEEEKNVPGEPLTPQDFKNAESLELLLPPQDENSPDPLEIAGLFEGDIAGAGPHNFSRTGETKNAIRDMSMRWPGGVIPYVISATFSIYERSVIAAAFKDYHEKTCIRLIPRTTQRDYIYILPGAGCSSEVGRSGNVQKVSLGPGCVYKGIIIHELMHAAGFWHEQSRADRDQHVRIMWQNIQRGMEYNFQKFNWRVMQNLDAQYDTGSVMHYGMYAFSKDRRSPTIVPVKSGIQLGQRHGFSKTDLFKLNRLYECNGAQVKPTMPPVKPTKPAGCVDNNHFCNYWSGIGECKRNPSWMLVNCAKSCKQCGTRCNNYNQRCERWASIGECIKNTAYMTVYCAKACGSCNTASSGDTSCRDHNRYCEAWAENKQCSANPDYMLVYCKKSCNQC